MKTLRIIKIFLGLKVKEVSKALFYAVAGIGTMVGGIGAIGTIFCAWGNYCG